MTVRVDLRALLEAATPGHWFAEIEDETALLQAETVVGFVYLADSDGVFSSADAALIVAAVNSLPRLLDRLERYEAALNDVLARGQAEDNRGGIGASIADYVAEPALAALSALDEQEPPA